LSECDQPGRPIGEIVAQAECCNMDRDVSAKMIAEWLGKRGDAKKQGHEIFLRLNLRGKPAG
jgi:hypothetical protein